MGWTDYAERPMVSPLFVVRGPGYVEAVTTSARDTARAGGGVTGDAPQGGIAVNNGQDRATKADPSGTMRLPDLDPKLFRPGHAHESIDLRAPLDSSDQVIDLTRTDPTGRDLEPQTVSAVDVVDTDPAIGTGDVVVDLTRTKSTDRVIDLAVNGSVHARQWPTTVTPRAATERDQNLKIHRWPARAAKRCLDLIICVPLLVLALPIIGACMLLISLTSRGPALFRQERIGRDREAFKIMKLRTMRADAEHMLQTDPQLAKKHIECGFKLPADEDPRITRVGRFLRKTSLDELPQLVHVVSGEMSLVGPRPLVKPEVARLYGTDADLFLSVKPGITGMWQVNGRSCVAGSRRAALEKRYLRHWSIKRDVGIILKTIPAVMTASGAH